MKFYTFILMVLVGLLSTMLITRKDLDGTIMRTPGMLYQERGTDSISNLYNIKLVNKTVAAVPLSLKLESMPGQLEIIGYHAIDVKAEGQGSGSFFVILPLNLLTNRKTEIAIGLYQGSKKVDELKTNFLGPVK